MVELINKLLETPDDDLHEVLSKIDSWKWPRSDLNAWIKVLNKFDGVLEDIIKEYEIEKIQINPFTPVKKKTISEVLRFERMLLENSTNRKTFDSYDVSTIAFAFTAADIGICVYISICIHCCLHPTWMFLSSH